MPMPTPQFYGGLGFPGPLAGAGPPVPAWPNVSISGLAHAFVAHFYDRSWNFVASSNVLNHPVIQQDINSGLQPVTLEFAVNPTATVAAGGLGLALGDLVLVSEQDGSGRAVFGGVLESAVDSLSSGSAAHQVVAMSFVANLGDTFFSKTYTAPTDIGQIVRDAVSNTAYVSCNFITVPATIGVLVQPTFNNTTVLDAINQCRQMAGQNFFWYVDEVGTLWFQPTGSAATASQFYTIPDAQISERSLATDISTLKNKIRVYGGFPALPSPPPTGAGTVTPTSQIVGTYDGSSQSTYGVRKWDPDPHFPAITDQGTINAIAASLGGMFDRVKTTVKLKLPGYSPRIELGQPGGPLMRYWEPSLFAEQESEGSLGAYSPSYVVLQVQRNGPEQVVTLGDLPYNGQQDYQWEVVRTVQRLLSNAQVYSPDSLNTGTVLQSTGTTIVTDTQAQPVQRLQFGNLGAYTDQTGVMSPAEFGMRALDAGGNIIFDTIGIAQIMQSLGFLANGALNGSVSTASTSTWADFANTSFTFTTTRPVRILYVIGVAAKTAGGSGQVSYLRGDIVGFDNTAGLIWDKNNTGWTNGFLWYFTGVGGTFTTIPAGTWTANLQGATDNGQTLTVNQFFHQVFLLGG